MCAYTLASAVHFSLTSLSTKQHITICNQKHIPNSWFGSGGERRCSTAFSWRQGRGFIDYKTSMITDEDPLRGVVVLLGSRFLPHYTFLKGLLALSVRGMHLEQDSVPTFQYKEHLNVFNADPRKTEAELGLVGMSSSPREQRARRTEAMPASSDSFGTHSWLPDCLLCFFLGTRGACKSPT